MSESFLAPPVDSIAMDLKPNEVRFIELLRSMPTGAVNEVADFAAFKAARSVSWSYDDPASCARAMERMADDPEMQREVREIERDFAPTMNDGLENL